MTNSEKIRELHHLSIALLVEYRVLTNEISASVKEGRLPDTNTVKTQHAALVGFTKVMSDYKVLLNMVVKCQVSFSSLYHGLD